MLFDFSQTPIYKDLPAESDYFSPFVESMPFEFACLSPNSEATPNQDCHNLNKDEVWSCLPP